MQIAFIKPNIFSFYDNRKVSGSHFFLAEYLFFSCIVCSLTAYIHTYSTCSIELKMLMQIVKLCWLLIPPSHSRVLQLYLLECFTSKFSLLETVQQDTSSFFSSGMLEIFCRILNSFSITLIARIGLGLSVCAINTLCTT